MSDHNRRLLNLVNVLTKKLFEHEEKRLKEVRIKLAQENARLGGSPDGFFYESILFTQLADNIANKGKRGNLKIEMIPKILEYIKDDKLIKYEKGRIKQFLSVLIKDCRVEQDLRDALPNCLVNLTELNQYERTREEAYTLLGTPLYNQYLKVRPSIEFYAGTKLLY